MRGYRSADDLEAVGRLLRRAWARHPGWNAWTFARFDIWSHWRLADERLEGETAWQDDLAVWEVGGETVAASFVGESSSDGVIVCDPGRADLVPVLLSWLEWRRPSGELQVEARASNRALVAALLDRGYRRHEQGHYIPREKLLDPMRDERVLLPPDVHVVELHDDEVDRYNVAVRAVFGHVGGTPEAYAVVRRCPSAVQELGLVALDGRGTVVAFAEAWLDRDNLVAEFEPVGTVPARRRQGISAALVGEAENRLRRLGCRLATVHSWSTMDAANGLYASLGYAAAGRQDVWLAPGRGPEKGAMTNT